MPLPRPLRLTVIFALVLSMWTGTFAAAEAMTLATVDPLEWRNHPHSTGLADPALERQMLEAQATALENMRGSRSFVLALLSMACAVMTIGAIRVLKPFGLPREGVIRLLGGASLVAAVLRSVDGAQLAAVAQKTGLALAPGIDVLLEIHDPHFLEEARRMLPTLFAAASGGWTALIAGTLLILGQYFRSSRVRKLLVEQRPSAAPR